MSGRRALAAAVSALASCAAAIAVGGCGGALDRLRADRTLDCGPARRRIRWRRTPPRAVLARFAVIGDYGIDSAAEARGGADGGGLGSRLRHHDRRQQLSLGSKRRRSTPTSASTTRASSATTAARTARAAPMNRFWPSPGNHDWDDGTLAPYTRLLHAARQRALLRRRHRPRPPVRARQRPPRAGRQHRRLAAGALARGGAGGVVVLLRRRLLPPPRLLLRASHGSYARRCAGRSRAGGRTSSSPATTTSTSASTVGGIRHITVGAQRQRDLHVRRTDRRIGDARSRDAARCWRRRAKMGSRFSSSTTKAPRSTHTRRSSRAAHERGRPTRRSVSFPVVS